MECVKHKRRFVSGVPLFIAFLLIVSVSTAEEKTGSDWTITAGLGFFHGPEYEGSDEAETVASANFEVVWKDKLFLNQDALGINYYNSDSLNLSAIISEGDERKESFDASLNGLGNISPSTTLTLAAEFDLGLLVSKTSLTTHIGGSDGMQALIGLEAGIPLGMLTGTMDMASIVSMGETVDLTRIGSIVIMGLSVEWADDDHTSVFFGVDAGQSLRSGLPQYTAEAGFKSFNLEFGVLYPVNNSWTVLGLAGYSKFISDARDSPIVKADDHVFVGGFLGYHF